MSHTAGSLLLTESCQSAIGKLHSGGDVVEAKILEVNVENETEHGICSFRSI